MTPVDDGAYRFATVAPGGLHDEPAQRLALAAYRASTRTVGTFDEWADLVAEMLAGLHTVHSIVGYVESAANADVGPEWVRMALRVAASGVAPKMGPVRLLGVVSALRRASREIQ